MSQPQSFRLINPPPEADHITDPETGRPVPNPRAGEPQPFVGLGVSHAVPTMVGSDVLEVAQTVYIGGPTFLKAHPQALPSQLLPVEVSDDGQIITASGIAARILAAHEQFEETDPPKSTSGGPTVAELRDTAERLGVDPTGLKKAELVAAIQAAQTTERLATGESDTSSDPTTDETPAGEEA